MRHLILEIRNQLNHEFWQFRVNVQINGVRLLSLTVFILYHQMA